MPEPAVFAIVNDVYGDIGFLSNLFSKLPGAVSRETGKKLDLIALIGNTPGSQMYDAELADFEKAWLNLVSDFNHNRENFDPAFKIRNAADWGSYCANMESGRPLEGEVFRKFIGVVENEHIMKEGILVPRFKEFYRDLGEAMKPARAEGINVRVMGTTIFHNEALPSDSYLDWKRLELRSVLASFEGHETTDPNASIAPEDAPLLAFRSGKSIYEDAAMRCGFFSDRKESSVIVCNSKIPEKTDLIDGTYYLIISGQKNPIAETKKELRASANMPNKIFDEVAHKFPHSPVGVYVFDGRQGEHIQFVCNEAGAFTKASYHQFRLHPDESAPQTVVFMAGLGIHKSKSNGEIPPPLPEEGTKDVVSAAKKMDLESRLNAAEERAANAEAQCKNAISDSEKLSGMLAYFVQLIDERIQEGNPELYAHTKDKTPMERANKYFAWLDSSFRKLAEDNTKLLEELRHAGVEAEKKDLAAQDELKKKVADLELKLENALNASERADNLIYDHAGIFNFVKAVDTLVQQNYPEIKGTTPTERVLEYMKIVHEGESQSQTHIEALKEQLRLERDMHDAEMRLKEREHETLTGQVNAAQTELDNEKERHKKESEELAEARAEYGSLMGYAVRVVAYLKSRFGESITGTHPVEVFKQFVEKELDISEDSATKELRQKLEATIAGYETKLAAAKDRLARSYDDKLGEKEDRIAELEGLVALANSASRQLSMALGKAKHYKEAIFACTNAISTAKKEDPLLASLYFNRAIMYAHLTDYQYAIKDLKEVLRINPNHKNAKQFMGGLEREVQKRVQQQ